MSRSRRAGALTAVTVVLLFAAGCTSAPDGTTTTTAGAPSAAVSATSSLSTTEATSPAPSAAPSTSGAPVTTRTDPNAPKGQCADGQLSVTVQKDPQGGATEHIGSWVVFRNTGRSSCVLRGAPGVSVVGHGDGTQLGRAASHPAGAPTPTVTIDPGGYALAQLVSTVVTSNGGAYADGDGDDPQCDAAEADGYRVYPPHSFRAVFVRSPRWACTTGVDWMRIDSVQSKVDGFTPTFRP